MIRFLRSSLAPLLCSGAAFLAGFVAFHPGWKKAAPLTEGSAASFQRVAEQIEERHLLDRASPQERVRRLLEICRQPEGLARDHALYEAIQHMQPGDFLAAVADLPALGRELTAMDGNVRAGLIEAGMERWLAVDKDAALRWLALARGIIESGAIELPQKGAGELGAAYAVLAAREPEWLRGQIEKLGEKTQREAAIQALMSAEVERDPKKAREWLETFRGSKEWERTFTVYVGGLSTSDPRGAMEMALSEDGQQTRPMGDLATGVFMSISSRSPALAAELLPKFDAEKRRELMGIATYVVGQSGADPFAWFADRVGADPALLDFESDSEQDVEFMMQWLVRSDPLRTLEMINTLPEAPQQKLRQATLASWSEFQPDTFLDWLAEHANEASLNSFKNIETTARQEPDRFARWVETLPAGELRDHSQLTLASELAKQGRFADALRHFPRSTTLEGSSQTARELGSAVGSGDPNAGAQWLRSLPAGPAQLDAARGFVGAWAGTSPQPAAQWVESLPAGGLRDAATGALAGAFTKKDPESATVWIEQISDSTIRATAVQQVFRSWAQTDAGSAREWLRDCPGVSDALKGRLLRRTR